MSLLSPAPLYLRIFSSGVSFKCPFSRFHTLLLGLDGLGHAEFLGLIEFEKLSSLQFWVLVPIHVSRTLEAPALTSLFHI